MAWQFLGKNHNIPIRSSGSSWTSHFVILRSDNFWYKREINRAGGYFELSYSDDFGVTWDTLMTLDLTEDSVIIDLAHLYRHRIVDGEYRVDNVLTVTGYAGTEGVDWENLYTGSGYWNPQTITDIFEDYYIINSGTYQANDHIASIRTGSSAYLTVVDATPGAETFQCLNNDTYKTADTDFIWFRQDASQRTVTTAELIGYDLQRTPVKYLDNSPNTIEEMGILKAGKVLTANERLLLFFYMHLPILWDNSLNGYGHVKSNRIGQNLWVKEEVLGAELVNQATWCAVGLAYWNEKGAAWSGDDVKITGVNASVTLCKYGALTAGKKYRINTTITKTSGSINYRWGAFGVTLNSGVNSFKTNIIVGDQVNPYFLPTTFSGLITAYSIKEILYE